ncbi:MAG: patatin-like phospholipase family protein [Verrucomicrobiota bacterium]|nr:patatin-like phospholipase family protein [Verrucomicrobiota bacterium]
MKASDFTIEVHHLVSELRRDLAEEGKVFSDIVDDSHQYVDLVMEGGGVLGVALVGFTYVLEQAGLRFLRVGGASAGAINALLLAGLGRPAEAKSEKIVELLANLDMYEFVDGDADVRRLVDSWVQNAGRIRLGLHAARVWDNVRDDLGLNPGKVFHDWLTGVLRRERIATTAQLEARMKDMPASLRRRDGRPLTGEQTAGLALIAADISTETKAVFPKMAPLYWAKPREVNPAKYVRASMSIPFFFHPYRVENVPQGREALDRWKELAGYEEMPPPACIFIDGGIMSNFPIDLFHKPERVPSVPTFGVKLGTDRRRTSGIDQPMDLVGAVFNSARHCLDYDFIARNPDYRKLVTCIDTKDHNWLNFNMKPEEKIELFVSGARAADHFLRKFNWVEYKKIRRGIAAAYEAAHLPKDEIKDDNPTSG